MKEKRNCDHIVVVDLFLSPFSLVFTIFKKDVIMIYMTISLLQHLL